MLAVVNAGRATCVDGAACRRLLSDPRAVPVAIPCGYSLAVQAVSTGAPLKESRLAMKKSKANEPPEDDEAADGRVLKLDDATLKLLARVRKGKYCRFLLSTKGSRVGALLLKKSNRRITPAEVATSREGGYQAVWGLVSGKGMQIHFEFSIVDGFRSLPSIKPAALKKFLNAVTDEQNWRWQPTMELVPEPPPLPFEEESLDHPFVKRFLALEAQTPKLLADRPELARELKKRFTAVRSLLGDEETLTSAGSDLGRLERMFRDWQESEPDEKTRSFAEIQRELAPKLTAIWKKQGAKFLPRLDKLRAALQAKSAEKRFDQAFRMIDTLQGFLEDDAPTEPERAEQLRRFLARDASFQTFDKYLKMKTPLITLLDGFEKAFRLAAR